MSYLFIIHYVYITLNIYSLIAYVRWTKAIIPTWKGKMSLKHQLITTPKGLLKDALLEASVSLRYQLAVVIRRCKLLNECVKAIKPYLGTGALLARFAIAYTFPLTR